MLDLFFFDGGIEAPGRIDLMDEMKKGRAALDNTDGGSDEISAMGELKCCSENLSANFDETQASMRHTFVGSGGGGGGEFCVPWYVDSDAWWTRHPDWSVSRENRTHYCFAPMSDPEKASLFRRLHEVQFGGNCSNAWTRFMNNQGWASDFRHVIDALQHAAETGLPTQLHQDSGWMFTVGPQAWTAEGRQFVSEEAARMEPVCPRMDLSCYFLDISSCPPTPRGERYHGDPDPKLARDFPWMGSLSGIWLVEYATRPKSWLRERLYRFYSRAIDMRTPCTAFHVRRGDSVLVIPGKKFPTRRYHAIEEYVNAAGESITKNILLLTDDHNAIGEALTKFPGYNWMYTKRKRHRGSEGGFENTIPSGDPVQEVVAILSAFRSVQKCSTLVHSTSSFAEYLRGAMESTRQEGLRFVNMDDGLSMEKDVFSDGNAEQSLNISRAFSFKA